MTVEINLLAFLRNTKAMDENAPVEVKKHGNKVRFEFKHNQKPDARHNPQTPLRVGALPTKVKKEH